jgi:hypothetical protein
MRNFINLKNSTLLQFTYYVMIYLLCCVSSLEAQFSVTSVSPSINSIMVGANDVIEISFSDQLNPTTITPQSIRVYGSQKGQYNFTSTYNSGTRTLFLHTSPPFKEGEIVSVVVTDIVRSTGGLSLISPYQWQFTVRMEYGMGSFTESDEYPLSPGSEPVSIFTGDLNRNQYPDLATVTINTGVVTILGNLGRTAGIFEKFAVAREIPTGSGGSHITGGDLTGDGYFDLIVTNTFINQLTLLTRSGSGFAYDTRSIPTGERPIMSAVADFNNDGILDIAVVAAGSDHIVIHINSGNGNFSQPVFYTVGATPIQIVTRDFNNDGYIDIAVAIAGDERIEILVNDGSGAFTTPHSIPLSYSPGSIAANVLLGSVNGNYGDGLVDIAVTARDNTNLEIFRNSGSEEIFSSSASINLPSAATGMILADIDTVDNHAITRGLGKDYDLDIITTHFTTDRIHIRRNSANESYFLEQGINIQDIQTPFGIVAADFDLDGDNDLAVVNFTSGRVTVLYNEGGRVFICGLDCEPELLLAGLNFGEVCLRQTVQRNFTLRNTGLFPVLVHTSTSHSAFSVQPDTFTINPGQSVVVTAYFSPTETREYTGAIVISGYVTELLLTEELIIPVRGTGVSGSITAAETFIEFGQVIAGQTSSRSISLHNSGNIQVSVTSFDHNNPAFRVSPTSNIVPPGGNLSVQLTFSPEMEGEYRDTLYIRSSDICELIKTPVIVYLRGTATPMLPDLIAENLNVTSSPVILNRETTFQGNVRNTILPVNSPFRLALLRESELIADTLINSMGVDEEVEVTFTVRISTLGGATIRFVVDYDNQIEELTKDNNERSIRILVERGNELIVRPNPFTPNNDGFNDRVGFSHEQIGVLRPRIRIFSLEGRLITTLTDSEGMVLYWNGLDDFGREMRPGVYLYTFGDGSEILSTGTITLAR